MLPVITIAGLSVYSYNLCVAAGLIAGILYFIYATKNSIPAGLQDNIIALVGADIPFIILGAILHNKIVYAGSLREFTELLFQDTGIAFLGGLLGGILGFVLLHGRIVGKDTPLMEIGDLIAPSIILGHAIGRIGCLLGGCCYGKPWKYGFVFREGTAAASAYGSTALFPTQLLEALLLFLLFFLIRKQKKNRFFAYLFSYSIIRFGMEFLRGDDRGSAPGILSPAQTICVFIWLGLAGVHIWKRQNKRQNKCRVT